MALYKRPSWPPGSPWRSQAFISGGQPSLVLFGFWLDRGTHVSLYFQKKITDLVPDLIQNLRCLRHKASIALGITWLGLNASCSTRLPFTGLVFNWLWTWNGFLSLATVSSGVLWCKRESHLNLYKFVKV